MLKYLFFILITIISLHASGCMQDAAAPPSSVETIILTQELNRPWGMAFLDKNTILITERDGGLKLYKQGKLHSVNGLNIKVRHSGQGGLLDLEVHPEYPKVPYIYMTYTKNISSTESTTALVRFRLTSDTLVSDLKELFEALPYKDKDLHYGSRITFDRAGHLFISLGDRYDYVSAGMIDQPENSTPQDLSSHWGSIIRLNDDGTVPSDNPFVGQSGKMPEIFSFGHRNPQGLFFDVSQQLLFEHEHGAKGGDEINIIQPGKNYGWPIITYGEDYSGQSIGVGTQKTGLEEPIYYWVPSIAPSGMTLYTGNEYPQWTGNWFVGSLKYKMLVRVVMENGKVSSEEELFRDQFGRIRDVQMSPDGFLYLLTDEENGSLIKIVPKNNK